jgi:hypothetical protein
MRHLQSLFWETDWSRIDLQKNKRYVIERILELGDREAVDWLFSTYSQDEIRQVLKSGRNLSAKSKTYWAIVMDGR